MAEYSYSENISVVKKMNASEFNRSKLALLDYAASRNKKRSAQGRNISERQLVALIELTNAKDGKNSRISIRHDWVLMNHFPDTVFNKEFGTYFKDYLTKNRILEDNFSQPRAYMMRKLKEKRKENKELANKEYTKQQKTNQKKQAAISKQANKVNQSRNVEHKKQPQEPYKIEESGVVPIFIVLLICLGLVDFLFVGVQNKVRFFSLGVAVISLVMGGIAYKYRKQYMIWIGVACFAMFLALPMENRELWGRIVAPSLLLIGGIISYLKKNKNYLYWLIGTLIVALLTFPKETLIGSVLGGAVLLSLKFGTKTGFDFSQINKAMQNLLNRKK